MRFIMLGPPGAGKGTQASMLAEEFKIPHISTGDIFRNNIKNGTALGLKARGFMDRGLLVPDELTIEIVKDRLQQEDCRNGFILDGFPRTIPQAEYLDSVLKSLGLELDAVINVGIADENIIRRMSGRRVCPGCTATFHLVSNPPREPGRCDNCKTALIQRKDDSEETVVERLKTYHMQTEPLIEYYDKRGKLVTVSGEGSIESTSKELSRVVGVIKNDINKVKKRN